MTHTRKLASVLFLALSCLKPLCLNAQEVPTSPVTLDQTTGNVITNNWSGAEASTTTGGGFSGGYTPAYNPETNTVYFGYSTGTVSQAFPINTALSSAGIKVYGYDYSWQYYNFDMARGSLTGNISLTGPSGVLKSYSYEMPQSTEDKWSSVSGTQLFGSSYSSSMATALNISFTGQDDRFWAGYYGPQIRDVDVRLKYTYDPCVDDPLYSPLCPGFTKALDPLNGTETTENLVPYPGAVAQWGGAINNSYAIATALEHSGIGVQVHAINWSYDVRARDPYCASTFLFWCIDWREPWARVDVGITDDKGGLLYGSTRVHRYMNSTANRSYQYTFPEYQNSLYLGNFNFLAYTYDDARISNMSSSIVYTPDICLLTPLAGPHCPGYNDAMAKLQPPATSTQAVMVAESPGNTVETTITATPTAVTASVQVSANPTTTTASSTPTTNQSTQVTQTATITSSETKDKKERPSLSTILSIVSAEQNRISQVEQKTVAEAVAQAEAASQTVTQQAESVASTAVSQSIEIGAASAVNSQQQSSLTSQNISQTTIASTTTQRNQNVQTTNMLQVNRSDSSSSPNQAVAIGTSDVSQQSIINNEQPVLQTFSQSTNRLETEITKESEQSQLSQPMANNIEVNNRIESEVSKENDQVISLQAATVTKNETTPQTQNVETSQPISQTFTVSPPAQIISQDIPQIVIQEQIIENRPFRVNSATFDREPNVVADKEEKQESNPLYSLLPPQQAQQAVVPELETTKTELSAVSVTPVVTEAAEKTPVVEMQAKVSSGPSVNRSAPNNEAAGGVDIAMIANQPKGYEAYSIGLQDRPFYEPKEIYKGQKTVDNMRAVRFLNAASDKLHQELVDMQYQGDK